MSLTDRFVEVNGDQVHIIETVPSTPSSSPPVILVSGLGTPGAHWCAVQRILPPHIHSFGYDRLGTGRSDYPRTDAPRTAATLADELKDTLTAAGVARHTYSSLLHMLGLYVVNSWRKMMEMSLD